jgi:hypothetical protein
MELGAAGVLDAVDRPGAAIFPEVFRHRGMPVAGGVDRDAALYGVLDMAIQRRDDALAAGDGECAAGAEIILDVDGEQRGAAGAGGFGHDAVIA